MSVDYAWQCFSRAVDELASGTSTLPDRVVSAFTTQLLRLDPEQDLPTGLRADFKVMKERLTQVAPAGDEGSTRATISTMTDEEVQEIAHNICGMYDEIARRLGWQD